MNAGQDLKAEDRPAAALRGAGAFSRIDLLAVLLVVLLLGGWLGLTHLGERGRIARCARNLEILGEVMQGFATDHGGALPPAGVEALPTTWDVQLSPYLKPGPAKSAGLSDPRRLLEAVAPNFVCPSDSFQRGVPPRSYAMSGHDMKPDNWPPGPDNSTGVGLWWGPGEAHRLLGYETDNLNDLALVKLTWLPDPASTLVLTECPGMGNRLAQAEDLRVESVAQQAKAFNSRRPPYHDGRFNYLMADGHVELLTPLQTGGMDGHAGIWTIKKGD
jgi:prepilin-type processing-associated H-X9-DG protein